MGQAASQPSPASQLSPASSCPVDHKALAQCPVEHAAPPPPAECPVPHAVNPLNNIPALAQTPAPAQSAPLPTTRAASSIPRSDAAGATWDYPSPQQFYNALVRKGHATPAEEAHAPTMVAIHNFLNEAAWGEVLKWERRADPAAEVQLARFRGRPGEMSPKARLFLVAGWLLPSRFNTEPPFDRHDWIVRRPKTGEEVRYVIDYYSAPPEADGSPAFSLDVRPALDSVGSVKHRIAVATEDMWAQFRTDRS